jgi:hypothetical protein
MPVGKPNLLCARTSSSRTLVSTEFMTNQVPICHTPSQYRLRFGASSSDQRKHLSDPTSWGEGQASSLFHGSKRPGLGVLYLFHFSVSNCRNDPRMNSVNATILNGCNGLRRSRSCALHINNAPTGFQRMLAATPGLPFIARYGTPIMIPNPPTIGNTSEVSMMPTFLTARRGNIDIAVTSIMVRIFHMALVNSRAAADPSRFTLSGRRFVTRLSIRLSMYWSCLGQIPSCEDRHFLWSRGSCECTLCQNSRN